jgi:hypothetical protein
MLKYCVGVIVVFVQQWHPDRWARTPSLLGEAKRKFQQIQEAYSGNFLCHMYTYITLIGGVRGTFLNLFFYWSSVVKPEEEDTVRLGVI